MNKTKEPLLPPVLSLEYTRFSTEEAWKGCYDLPGTERKHFSDTRDYFLQLVQSSDSQAFEEYKEHGFWTHWRSRKNESTVLPMAVASARDIGWIRSLLDISDLREASSVTDTVLAVASRHNDHVKVMKILQEKTFWKPEPNLFWRLSHAGQWEPLAYLLAQGDYTQRIEGVEDVWAFKRRRPESFPKNMKQSDVFKALWKVWGVPSQPDMDHLLERSSGNGEASWRDLYESILETYNGKTGWSSKAASVFIYNALQDNPERLLETFEEGWVYTEEAWERARQNWTRNAMYHLGCAPRAEDERYFDSFRSRCFLAPLMEKGSAPNKAAKL